MWGCEIMRASHRSSKCGVAQQVAIAIPVLWLLLMIDADKRKCANLHSPFSWMGVMELSLLLGLFLGLPRRCCFFIMACWRRRSFSVTIWRMNSRCIAARWRSASMSSTSWVMWAGDSMKPGDALPELDTLWASSSKGSERKRSSSERNEVARSWWSLSDRDERRGHEGKAQVASCWRRLLGVMSMGAERTLMEL